MATLRSGSVVAKGRPYANAKRGLWPQLPRLCDRAEAVRLSHQGALC
ncbi:MAG: hypothetical protein F6K55_13195 [Moorea sp. SIO4A3]|nr:hypothetical protein [Moorena sp. SIO4A3]